MKSKVHVSGGILAVSLALAVLNLTIGHAHPVKADDGQYTLGHGLDVGPFNFAGYSNVTGDIRSEGNDSLTLDDLSLFISGHVDKFINPFVEAEFTHLDILSSSGDRQSVGHGEFELERFYNDINLTNDLTLRVGKMLSPVGEWNEIHAAPLVLTTVRPAVTYRNFSEYTTGVSVLYSDPRSAIPDLQIYWQPDGELSDRPADIAVHQYKNVAGGHISFPLEGFNKVGFSFQSSTDTSGVSQELYGANFNYAIHDLSFEGELTYSTLGGNTTHLVRTDEWGTYIASSYAIAPHWSVYSWYELFTERSSASTAQDILAGVAYRPQSAMVFKLEYLQNVGGRSINPTGLFASWSVLF